jgi:hypothetical protein
MAAITAIADDSLAAKLSRALGAQYELKGLLGRGGMGTVYLAREPFLDRLVAVKILTSELSTGDARERFLREARTAARLVHPHIVPLYTFGHAESLPYYVMGYVDGESLETRLERDGQLPAGEVRRITMELADALEYAHQAGIVHRDVKPDNVLLDRSTGRAMLTDFGVAKHWVAGDSLTVTGVIVGTPRYMSPEQASGDREIDGRSDVYALGVMAYQMATGRLPFDGATLREILVQQATRVPVPAGQLVPSLPLDLDAAITRALNRGPADRWGSAGELRSALSMEGEDAVPDALHAVGGQAVRMGLATAVVADVWLFGAASGFLDAEGALAVGISTLAVPVLSGLGLVGLARRYGWRQVLRQAFRQPGWWSTWWPAAWRRNGDVWHRLPVYVRSARIAGGIMIGLAVAFTNLFALALVVNPGDARIGTAAVLAAGLLSVALVPTLLWLEARVRKRARASGLTNVEAARLISEPTWNAGFWNKRHVAALLTPADADDITSLEGGREPADLAVAIERMAREHGSSVHMDVYREAAEAARAILDAVTRCDQQVAQLARDADPRERERIEERLLAMGSPAGDASPAMRQMRDLLDRQLQILQDLAKRQVDLGVLRSQLHESLRALTLQLARLRANDLDEAASSAITERLRVLMLEIDHRVQASDEVGKLLREGD